MTRCGPLSDEANAIERAVRAALSDSDLLVFIGGASVGPHDHGQSLPFWRRTLSTAVRHMSSQTTPTAMPPRTSLR